jgi:hypothetical protein
MCVLVPGFRSLHHHDGDLYVQLPFMQTYLRPSNESLGRCIAGVYQAKVAVNPLTSEDSPEATALRDWILGSSFIYLKTRHLTADKAKEFKEATDSKQKLQRFVEGA